MGKTMELPIILRNTLSTLLVSITLMACNNSSNQQNTATENQDSVTRIKEYGVIRVGVFGDKPPFGDIDTRGNSQGFDVEIAKQLSMDLFGSPDKVEFSLTRADDRAEYLESGKIDVLLANFTHTPERANQVDFAEPYMKVALGIVSPSSEPITHLSQLKGKKLLVTKGTTADLYFTQNHPEIDLVRYERNPETIQALREGKGAGFSEDNATLWAWANQNPGFEVGIGNIGEVENIAPAVKKGDAVLLNWVNQRIRAMKQDGRLRQAYDTSLKPVYGNKVNPKNLLAD